MEAGAFIEDTARSAARPFGGAITHHLNLPVSIDKDFDTETYNIRYLYNAIGQKISKHITQTTGGVSPGETTLYLDGYQYLNGAIQFFPHPEGYVRATVQDSTTVFSYVYQYKDHLGNIRMNYAMDKSEGIVKILNKDHYYPFGLKHNNYSGGKKDFRVEEEQLKIKPTPYGEENPYLYKYNGKEWQDEIGLNWYDYGARNYDPAMGRWMQSDPLLNYLDFTFNPNEIDEEDEEEVAIGEATTLGNGGGIYNTDNLNPYTYGYNDPIRFDDPDGRCPSCLWGGFIGGVVDYGLQVATNYAKGKTGLNAWSEVDITSIAVSAGAGALSGEISSISKLKSASTLTKVVVEVATDTGVSLASQGIKEGNVSLKKPVIDVTAGQVIGRGAGKAVEKKALNSKTGKQLQANINREKNIARGKSNTTPKSKANIKGAEKKFDRYVNTRATATSATASGAASTAAENAAEGKKQKKTDE